MGDLVHKVWRCAPLKGRLGIISWARLRDALQSGCLKAFPGRDLGIGGNFIVRSIETLGVGWSEVSPLRDGIGGGAAVLAALRAYFVVEVVIVSHNPLE